MGFKEIYLVGCNHSIPKGFLHFDGTKKPLSGKKIPWKIVTYSFGVVKNYADCHGIIIKNATTGSKLKVFKRIKLDKLFSKKL